MMMGALGMIILIIIAALIVIGDMAVNTLGPFETVSALLGAVLIGIFMVGLLEHRNRTIFKMGIDSASVIILFGMGVALHASLPTEDAAAVENVSKLR